MKKTFRFVVSLILIVCLSLSNILSSQAYLYTAVYVDENARTVQSQTKNYVFVFSCTSSLVGEGQIPLTFSNSLTLVSFETTENLISEALRIENETVSSLTLTYEIYEGEYNANDDMFILSMNLPADESTQPYITVPLGFVYSSYLLGDVDGDSDIDSDDALCANQGAVGMVNLTDAQIICADVNNDSVISTKDALLILHYSTGMISSFWTLGSFVPLPTSENEQIIPGKLYHIESSTNENSWWRVGNPSTGLNTKIYLSSRDDTYNQRFLFEYDNQDNDGTYFILPYVVNGGLTNSGYVIGVNANKELVTVSDRTVDSSKWYIVSNNGAFLIINKQYINDFVTSNGWVTGGELINSKNLKFSTWNINRVGFEVQSFYDEAFKQRYSWYNSTTNGIPAMETYTSNLFESLLGLEIVFQQYEYYESLADRCKISRNIELSNFASDDIQYLCDGSTDNHVHGYYTNPGGTNTNIQKNCTDMIINCGAFRSDKGDLTTNDFKTVYWGGHKMIEYDYTIQNNNGSIEYVWYEKSGNRSRAYSNMSIHMISNYSSVEITKSTFVHEMSHIVGAPDHYHERKQDSYGVWYCYSGDICSGTYAGSVPCEFGATNPRPYNCLMNVSSKSLENVSYEDVFCSECLNDMLEYSIKHY